MKKKSSFVFTGDIGFDKYMDKKWEDKHLITDGVLCFLHSGDHVVANVEGALIDLPPQDDTSGVKQLIHAMNPKAIKVLNNMHADVWNLCNNHILDAGEEGVAQTIKLADKNHVQTVGAGMNIDEAARPLLFDEAGGIGLFSVGYRRGCKPADVNRAGCLLWNDMERIQKNIDEIKKTCRWCVIVCHGGEEFTSLPSSYTRDRYHRFLEMGADVVVSHHPHVPMNYETVGDKVIFYSLGNFIFDTDYQRAQYNTERGILVKINFTEKKFTWDACGIRINRALEHVRTAKLPDIFVDVQAEEYKCLEALAAKMMISAYKRQLIYLNPKEYQNASEKKWEENFLAPKRSGRVEGEALDFQLIYPLAKKADDGKWKRSKLTKVVKYIQKQI